MPIRRSLLMRQFARSAFQKAARTKTSIRNARRSRFASIERLESRLAMAQLTVDVRTDYDTSGWFTDTTTTIEGKPAGQFRLDAFTKAANDLLSRLTDSLAEIPAPPGAGNSWTALFPNPST